MDLTLLCTLGAMTIAVIGSNIALFSWLRSDIALNRSEASSDRRDILQLMRVIQTELRSDIKAIEIKIDLLKDEVNEEMKDFHGRLCSLEARYHQKDEESKLLKNN